MMVSAQSPGATLSGVVRDGESRQPLIGATITLGEPERAVATNLRGGYRFAGVSAGPHHLSIRAIGFHPRTLHALVPRSGELVVDVSLARAPVRLRDVEVRSVTAGRDGETASPDFPDREATIAAIRNHPLLAEADVLQALRGGTAALDPESPSGIEIRGGASDQTGYLLDGIPVLSPYHAGGIFGAWNPDAIAAVSLSLTASADHPETLSGVVSATTRSPGPTIRAEGGFSSTQARVTVDGPLPGGRTDGAGFLVSGRIGFPGLLAPRGEASYLAGETGDWLAKVEGRALSGRIRVVAFQSTNELNAGGVGPARNWFEWNGQSIGVEWRRATAARESRLMVWTASSDAGSGWSGNGDMLLLDSRRRDVGLQASTRRSTPSSATMLGGRLQTSRTRYRLDGDAASRPFGGDLATATAFAERLQRFGRFELMAGTAATVGANGLRAGPRARGRWRLGDRVAISGSVAALHQYAFSLRNPESVAGAVFPAELYLGAGSNGITVGRVFEGAAAVEYRSRSGGRLGLQAFRRRTRGLPLVAPRTSQPFATSDWLTGGATATGVVLDGSFSGTRLAMTGSYGWQQVRWRGAGVDYPPRGAGQTIDAGLMVFPSGASSIRVGLVGLFQRRATPVVGPFEWEACNLLDRGCEFLGSPGADSSAVGSLKLPPYLRIDLGVRHHWHLRLRGHPTEVALFGTLTNVLGRGNLLTVAVDPATGLPAGAEMRPRAPLVIGLDWRF
jgi:hypothetical protein